MSAAPGLLELLHPDGGCGVVTVAGTGCPASLLPSHANGGPGPVDLAIVALGRRHEVGRGRLEHRLRDAAESLAPDGLLCCLAPPTQRGRMARILREGGLKLVDTLYHHATLPGGWERLVSLERGALRHASGRFIPPGAPSLLRRCHPRVILVATRPGARALLEWVLPGGVGERTFIQGVRRRRQRASVVVQVLQRGSGLLAVAKLSSENGLASDRIVREADLLSRLAPGLRASGARVAAARLVRLPDGSPAAVESPVEGTQADRLLAAGRLGFRPFADALLHVLERWNQATQVARVCDRSWLEREVLGPAAVLSPRLDGGVEYLAWLHELCSAQLGRALPLVATHGDLTTSNILLEDGGALGLVDWEEASECGLPLRDLAYGLVDAAWAAGGRKDRVAAFSSCFESGGLHWEEVRRGETRLRQLLGLSDEFATLCLHACWLQHAVDEDAERGPAESRPFLQIVQRMARIRGSQGGEG